MPADDTAPRRSAHASREALVDARAVEVRVLDSLSEAQMLGTPAGRPTSGHCLMASPARWTANGATIEVVRAIAIVRGVGDIGSAVAHRLSREGYSVVLHDSPQPTATRRGMAFADAAFDGVAILEGMEARRAPDLSSIHEYLAQGLIAVSVGPFDPLVEGLKPDVLVDARMRKRAVPEDQRGLARVTIGLGPNFHAGTTCDVAVETSWDGLGRVISDGRPLPLAGEPRELGGHARERYVYAPCRGVFRTDAHIGDVVVAGQPIAKIEGTIVTAPLAGILRGLTHDGVPVLERTKVIEIDPRGRAAEVTGIAERPRRIAEGVITAIRLHTARSPQR